jgi:hypothetical protein
VPGTVVTAVDAGASFVGAALLPNQTARQVMTTRVPSIVMGQMETGRAARRSLGPLGGVPTLKVIFWTGGFLLRRMRTIPP